MLGNQIAFFIQVAIAYNNHLLQKSPFIKIEIPNINSFSIKVVDFFFYKSLSSISAKRNTSNVKLIVIFFFPYKKESARLGPKTNAINKKYIITSPLIRIKYYWEIKVCGKSKEKLNKDNKIST